MRLAFGIREILLSNNLVSDKDGDLKQCHFLYYKLADLWFAYENYLKFFRVVTGKGKYRTTWLDDAVHDQYASSPVIETMLCAINTKLTETFGSHSIKTHLIHYLQYCEQESRGAQRKHLASLIVTITEGNPLTHTLIFSMIYAIRNNFVHNGELIKERSTF